MKWAGHRPIITAEFPKKMMAAAIGPISTAAQKKLKNNQKIISDSIHSTPSEGWTTPACYKTIATEQNTTTTKITSSKIVDVSVFFFFYLKPTFDGTKEEEQEEEWQEGNKAPELGEKTHRNLHPGEAGTGPKLPCSSGCRARARSTQP